MPDVEEASATVAQMMWVHETRLALVNSSCLAGDGSFGVCKPTAVFESVILAVSTWCATPENTAQANVNWLEKMLSSSSQALRCHPVSAIEVSD
jgi:hypothetical protein